MRTLVSMLFAFAGAVHLGLVPGHVGHGRWLPAGFAAAGFLLLAAAGAASVAGERLRWAVRAGRCVAGLTALGYVVSRTAGLPGLEPERWDRLGAMTTLAEVVVLVLPALPALRRMRIAAAVATAAITALVATALPATAHHHGGLAAPIAGATSTGGGPSDRPANCVAPNAHRTLYVEELPPAADGSVRLGYGATPATASIPGPTIELTEGDCLAVTVVNDVSAATLASLRTDPSLPLGVSLHVHGVKYKPSSDGTVHNASYVPPGESRTYIWYAAPRVTAANRVISLGTAGYWWYHDHVVGTDHGTGGVGAGLFGAVVVRRPGDPKPEHTFVVPMGPDVSLGLRRHPDTPEYVAREGERVEFVAIGLGDGFHTFHLHGHNWANNRTGMLVGPADETALIDNKTIGPADSFGFQVIAGEEVGPGAWMLHCHVQTHSDTGMMTFFRVTPADGSAVTPAAAAGMTDTVALHRHAGDATLGVGGDT